jgi:hypothetical protein
VQATGSGATAVFALKNKTASAMMIAPITIPIPKRVIFFITLVYHLAHKRCVNEGYTERIY